MNTKPLMAERLGAIAAALRDLDQAAASLGCPLLAHIIGMAHEEALDTAARVAVQPASALEI